jgi:hypothetical protein
VSDSDTAETNPLGPTWHYQVQAKPLRRCVFDHARCELITLAAGSLFALGACGGGGSNAPPDTTDHLVSVLPASSLLAPTALPADPTVPWITSPQFGALGTGQAIAFAWTAVAAATGYELQVGSSRGASDLYESGVVSGQTVPVSSLPAQGTIYARVRAIVPGDPVNEPAGHWIHGSDVVFRTDSSVTGAHLLAPARGSVAPGSPLAWIADPVAISYRLRVGTSPGGSDIDDSGPVGVDQRLVPTPLATQTLYATLDTYYSTVTVARQIEFVAISGAISTSDRVAFARILTAEVRGMGNVDNQPYAGTLLYAAGAIARRGTVTCTDYTTALLRALADANAGLSARAVDVCLNPNSFDCHELVEALDPDSGRWSTLDPTFGLTTLRSDGEPATADEISSAVRALNWTALQFRPLTAQGTSYANGYYIDYPLLFVDVYSPRDSGFDAPVLENLNPYFTPVGTSVVNSWGSYALECTSGYSSATVDKDGTVRTYPCTGGTGVTEVMYASSLSAVAGDQSLATILQPKRFVF